MNTEVTSNTLERIGQVIIAFGELGLNHEKINAEDDLFKLGMSSRASVGVMLALETEFDIEFPDAMLRRDVFESIRSISNAIESLI
jgi:acyl carrier protein